MLSIEAYCEIRSRELLAMDRNRIRRVVGAITGHCGLNKQLTKLNIRRDFNCSCGLEEETGLPKVLSTESQDFRKLRHTTYRCVPTRTSLSGHVPGRITTIFDDLMMRGNTNEGSQDR